MRAIYRSSHRRCSVKKCVLRNFPKFIGKHMCQSLFFDKKTQKRDSDTGVFFWILRNFYRTPPDDCFWIYKQLLANLWIFSCFCTQYLYIRKSEFNCIFYAVSLIAVSMQCRSSRTEEFCKKCALRNVAKFKGKRLCQSLFRATLLRRRVWHRCFSVNFAKFLRTPFLTEHLRWMLLAVLESVEQRVSVTWFTILLAPCCSSIVCFASFQIFIRWFIWNSLVLWSYSHCYLFT